MNLVYPRWKDAYPVVQSVQKHWDGLALEFVDSMRTLYTSSSIIVSEVYQASNHFAESMTEAWWKLPDALMSTFVDGFTNFNSTDFGYENPNFYPGSWLIMMNYTSGPGYGDD